jgi:Histidine kinase-, DNA gyrase B-, and HSP90-like ATPase
MSTFESKSGVNVRRLVRNISDQYDFAPQIAALLELIANALDARATMIHIRYDAGHGQLIVEDDGAGMNKAQFRDYHDFASSTKARGSGIGFAGQGAKLALNFCSRVVTETWSREWRGYSEWRLEGNDAPYRVHEGELPTLDHQGTQVILHLSGESKDFYSRKLIHAVLLEHFYPLIDRGLRAQYPDIISKYQRGVTLLLDDKPLVEPALEAKLAYFKEIKILVQHQTKAFGWFGVYTGNGAPPIPSGIMLCTYGKVIERTYLKKEPHDREQIFGWIEAPYLIEAVTTDKCRFQKGNKRWETFFRRAQSEFTAWLEQHQLVERAPRKPTGSFVTQEREINNIIKNMPELAMFATHAKQDAAVLLPGGELVSSGQRVPPPPLDADEADGRGESESEPNLEEENKRQVLTALGDTVPGEIRPRVIRGGVHLMEVERDDKSEESWFDGTTVTINQAHPAYRKAAQSGNLNYHIFKCVALSLIEFTMENDPEPNYRKVLDLQRKFFSLWGER